MRIVGGVVALVLSACVFVAPTPAYAQQEVQVAATAFAEGQQAQLRGDFVRAAELFEIADQAVPSPAALRSAIRNREAAGQAARAATLALRALERHPDDRDTRTFAEGVLARLGPKLARLRVRCDEPCTATADGGLLTGAAITEVELFVTPGPHTLRAAWAGREPLVQTLELAAGETREVPFQAPAITAEAPALADSADSALPAPRTELAPAPTPAPPPRAERSGWSPTVFWVGVGLTAVAAGALTWSGLDTLSARDDYEDDPTRPRYEDGVALERRTNVLLGVTALLGLGTAGIGLFATDWQGAPQIGLAAGPNSASLSVTGVLP